MNRRFAIPRCRVPAIVVALLVGFADGRAQDAPAAPPKGVRVFVCGHSFHAFIGEPLAAVAKSAGIAGHEVAGRQALGGSRVLQHWDLPDDKNQVKAALRAGKVDVLTLSPHLKLPDEGIDKFAELALEHNPNVRIVVQASWYPYDTPGHSSKNFKNDDRDRAKIEDLRKAYEPIDAALPKQIDELNARYRPKYGRDVAALVPAGHAVMNLREKVAAGQVPGVAKQSELFTDPIGHPRPPVALLVVYCNYAVIYGRSPVGLPLPKLLSQANPAWDDKLNRVLQEVAWDAATKRPPVR